MQAVKLTIERDELGNVSVDGSVQDQILWLGLLEVVKASLLVPATRPQPKPQMPNLPANFLQTLRNPAS